MQNGWTGGQYSLFRLLFGAWLALIFLFSAGSPVTQTWWVSAAALLFAAGQGDRPAAVVLLLALGLFEPIASPGFAIVAWLLLSHLLLPHAPYLSWAARRRVDPGAGWRMPGRVYTGVWIVLAASLGVTAIDQADGLTLSRLAVLPLLLFARARPFVWVCLFLLQLLLLLLGEPETLFWLHLLAFDPAWIRPRVAGHEEYLFYDGGCGLCQGTVRFALAEDSSPQTLLVAPLHGETYRKTYGDGADLPDSIVVRTAQGDTRIRSDAVLHLLARLGGCWRTLGAVASIVPRPFRDRVYDGVARVRHRLFRRPDDACPTLPPRLRARFRP